MSTSTPRTPRRTCKDLALGRILAIAEKDAAPMSRLLFTEPAKPGRRQTSKLSTPTPSCKTPLRKRGIDLSLPRLEALSITSPRKRSRSMWAGATGRSARPTITKTRQGNRSALRSNFSSFSSNESCGEESSLYQPTSSDDEDDNSSVLSLLAASPPLLPTDSPDSSFESTPAGVRGRGRSRKFGTPINTPVKSTPNRRPPGRRSCSLSNSHTLSSSHANTASITGSSTGPLPGREYEFESIYTFITNKLRQKVGGCIYISGLPGTGKTASVNAVLSTLKADKQFSLAFRQIIVNGMQVNDPRHVYPQIYTQLTGKQVSPIQAARLLEAYFTTTSSSENHRRLPVVLLIDELDLLCNRRQDVLYNLFDWPTRCNQSSSSSSAQRSSPPTLIVLAIANTMDLPDRLLHPRVASRLGLSRLTFAPYTHDQLSAIVREKLVSGHAATGATFKPKALELASRKVAAVSGDIRRALDICRRAAELAISAAHTHVKSSSKQPHAEIDMDHVNAAVKEMFSAPKFNAIRACSLYEKLFLRGVVAEFQARSTEESRLDRCIEQVAALCHLEGFPCPTTSELFTICSSLGAHKLLLTESAQNDTSLLIRLNCSKDDILFALKNSTS